MESTRLVEQTFDTQPLVHEKAVRKSENTIINHLQFFEVSLHGMAKQQVGGKLCGWFEIRGWQLGDFSQRQMTQAAMLLQISVLLSPLTMAMQNSYNERLEKKNERRQTKGRTTIELEQLGFVAFAV
jgi:hypothetical protein